MNLLILVLLLIPLALGLDLSTYETPRINKDFSSICVPVKYSGGNAFVKLELEHYRLAKGDEDNVKIPTMIIHLTDLLDTKKIPLMSEYNKLSSEKKFELTNGEKFNLQDRDHFYNGFLSLNGDKTGLKFDVDESGYYCVYIAPPDSVKEVNYSVVSKNSYGYMMFSSYLQYKFGWLTGIILIATNWYLFQHLMKTTGSEYQNLNGLSVISKFLVFYIISPYTLILLGENVLGLVMNNVAKKGFFLSFLAFGYQVVEIAFQIYVQYLLLMFCMGYGVIYYHRQTKFFRQMPASRSKFATALLFIGVVLFFLIIVTSLFSGKTPSVLYGSVSEDQTGTPNVFDMALNAAAGLVFFVSYVSSVILGIKTIKVIKEYPPYDANVEDYIEKNDQLRKSFRRSLLVIFVLPIYASVVSTAFMIFTAGKSYLEDLKDVNPALIGYYMSDFMIENTSFLYYLVINNFVLGLVILVSLYFIWIKGNHGVAVSKEEETGDYTDFREPDQIIV